MHEKILILTVGLPYSGKTTWARAQGFPLVNVDAVRASLHGQRFQALAEPFVWAIVQVMVRALFLAGHDKVVLDSTNLKRRNRGIWHSGDLWQVRFKLFNVSVEECLKRASDSNDPDILPVINRMSSESEPLTDEERKLLLSDG